MSAQANAADTHQLERPSDFNQKGDALSRNHRATEHHGTQAMDNARGDRRAVRWFRSAPTRAPSKTVYPLVPEIRPILNADLTEADLPPDDAVWDQWPGISWFAGSFNDYQHWGSFEKCFEIGRQARHQPLHTLTLTELRTVLFCRYRTICHVGEATADDVSWARTIIEEIRHRIRRRAID